MKRADIIEALILNRIHSIVEERYTVWLHCIIENGFIGYANMPDDVLRLEFRKQGLERLECESDTYTHDEIGFAPF
ncbi:MAG: hypothetical protein ACREUA_07830 [Burkholderiales bacterium]